MDINIQNDLIELDQSIEKQIQRKLRLVLSKVESNISFIIFKVSDITGHNDSYDKYCLLTTLLYQMSDVYLKKSILIFIAK